MDESAPYAYHEDVNWGLLRLWGGRTGAKVLDVGCGFATTSERLKRLGNHVTGIESSPDAVKVAAARIDEVVAADLQRIDELAVVLGSRTFDTIIFADVLDTSAGRATSRWGLRSESRARSGGAGRRPIGHHVPSRQPRSACFGGATRRRAAWSPR